jgi:N-formylglutamate amidohydrolase
LKIQELKEHFKSLGYSVNLNFPFSGSYLPEYNIENPNVFTVMIEVNKDLYMSKDGFVPLKKDSFNKLKEDITNGIMIFA